MKRKTNRESFGVMATLFSLLVTTSFVLLRPGESGAQERDATVDLLAELTNAHGVVGFEGEVRDILRREWRGLLTDLRTRRRRQPAGHTQGPVGIAAGPADGSPGRSRLPGSLYR